MNINTEYAAEIGKVLSNYDKVKDRILPYMLTDAQVRELNRLHPQTPRLVSGGRQFVPVMDIDSADLMSHSATCVTPLSVWGKEENEVYAQAVANLERTCWANMYLQEYRTEDVFEGTLPLHRPTGCAAVERYGAGILLVKSLLNKVYQLLGTYYIYLSSS